MEQGHQESAIRTVFRPRHSNPIEGVGAYVLYFDILGFRAALKRDDAALAAAYRGIMGVLDKIRRMDLELDDALGTTTKGFRNVQHMVVFSDSGFVFIQDETEESYRELCAFANLTFRDCLNRKLPIRGAIAAGRVWSYPDEGIFLGEGVNRAYELAESIEAVGIVTLEERWLDATIGPCVARLKTGGALNVRVPKRSRHGGTASGAVGLHDKLKEMRAMAVESGNPNSISKYDSSNEVTSSMLE